MIFFCFFVLGFAQILSLVSGKVFDRYGYDEIVVDSHRSFCEVSENFLSIAIDTKFIFYHNIHHLRENSVFMTMLEGLQPAYLRIGGTAADLVLFDERLNDLSSDDFYQLTLMDSYGWDDEDSKCVKKSLPELRLSHDKWLTINSITSKSGLNLLFDLNVLIRKNSGKWDPTNAYKLLEFSQANNLTLDWQLGNEPNSFCHVFGQEVLPTQLASDFDTLSKILTKFPLYKKSKLVGPDITAPRGPKKRQIKTLHYLDQFLSEAKKTISAATWHQYYISGRNATLQQFMDPLILDVLSREIKDVKEVVVKNTNKHFPIWITETASAFGGGAPGLSDRFVSGFMWLDKLGIAASNNISVVIRQSFIGGNYGLLDAKTLEPNSDFWVSYLFKQIVGQVVLKLETSHKNPLIRMYAHCPKKSQGGKKSIVIFGMNLSSSEYKGFLATNHINYSDDLSVEKYILTGVDGQVDSRGTQLNGEVLKLTRTKQLPPLNPIHTKTNIINLPPQSLGFYVVKNFAAPVC